MIKLVFFFFFFFGLLENYNNNFINYCDCKFWCQSVTLIWLVCALFVRFTIDEIMFYIWHKNFQSSQFKMNSTFNIFQILIYKMKLKKKCLDSKLRAHMFTNIHWFRSYIMYMETEFINFNLSFCSSILT